MIVEVSAKFIEKDKFKIYAVNTETNIIIDQKQPDHETEGPNPLELFLSSLAGCIGTFAKKYLTRHNIEFKKINVRVEADFSTDSPMRLADINVHLDTDAELGSKKDTFYRFIENCPIHNTILHTKEIKISLKR